MAILQVSNLEKRYGNVRAVDGISFSVAPGEIVGLLGPNGAGKTTTIDMILGLVEPTSGLVTMFGMDFRSHRSEILEQMNFAATYAHLPGNLNVRENLHVFSHLYTINNRKQAIVDALKTFDLERFAGTRTGFLSSGEQTRVGIAKALLNKPRLLLLDEPTASLDPSTADEIRKRLLEYRRTSGASILWTSHDMIEIARVCDRVLFISHGKVLLEGDPRGLPAKYGKHDLEELFISVAREPLTLELAA
ncbi:MAG: ABC transporter ATP-binding protein [Candidatus Yanofskybacteria bacterium RIFCSPLOWO2_01_FULL_49_25]|uniref:ABC transporter ATP-binding protein n=1 Tax=Candidatus Yanofskybacteria bacterium RIFCSPLOWO2_01_FULL_49_25 TaxID=1802701 RepID=A0A1F8GTW7_9BACT|nr:MAG: ABC transporter ATP-binding protein [Candidatus Yanofskybacteria bacterium RIFCSPLOWO2_01_FULL_49_25]